MRRTGSPACLAPAIWALAAWPFTPLRAADPSDVILKAMRDEIRHSRALSSLNLAKPYFISYVLEDGEGFSATASLGGLEASTDTFFRFPRVQVRAGDYDFDSTNYAGSGQNAVSRYEIERFPIENSYAVLRRYLWLATDQSYKSAVETLARKQAALKNVSEQDRVADFARAEPIRVKEAISNERVDRGVWLARVRTLSAVFADFPQVMNSSVEMQALKNVRYLVNSEGSEVRTSEDVIFVRIRGTGQAADGMVLRDFSAVHSLGFDGLPAEAELARACRQVAENITALAHAPAGDTYNGPVLFEGMAAAQIFAGLLGKNLAQSRKPVGEAGRPNRFLSSELEGRQGARILPESMDVVDDPAQKEWHGRKLFGAYRVDDEGVAAKPLTLVEKGVLKNFALTRQPVSGFSGSNGRARLPGAFGSNAATTSNLFVRVADGVPVAELRKKLIGMCQARGRPYGLIVRKLDFPSSASFDEVRRRVGLEARDGNGPRLVSLPILVYKIFPDGREELIRGVQFRELNVRSLRDIQAAGDDNNVFDYLDNGAPMALVGASSYSAECSVIAPSVLLDDVEVRKLDDERPSLPVVPSPLVAGR